MSTSVHDLPASTVVGGALPPIVLEASGAGSTIDLGNADGPCFAVQQVGSVSGGATLAGRIEQSSDGSSWAAISGATFTTVSASNDIQAIRFDRTARYVRWAATITGTDPEIAASAVIGQQRKTF